MSSKIESCVSAVCFLADVYGFSARVRDDSLDAHRRLLRLHHAVSQLLEANRRTFPDRVYHSYYFSDNLCVAGPLVDDTQRHFVDFLSLAEDIHRRSVEVDLPLRGCITFGELTFGPNTIVGPALVEAARYEKTVTLPLVFLPLPTLAKLRQRGAIPDLNRLRLAEVCDLHAGRGLVSAHPLVCTHRDELQRYALDKFEECRRVNGLEDASAAWKSVFTLVGASASKRSDT